jgi:polyamine oxidase
MTDNGPTATAAGTATTGRGTATTGTAPKSLIVIGAGMAGIKLAHRCLEENPNLMEIVVLEANDYIGGRICSFPLPFANNYLVEKGANWISGLEEVYENPIWKLAQAIQLQGHASEREYEQEREHERTGEQAIAAFDDRGNDVSQQYLASAQRFHTVYEQAIHECARRKLTPSNDQTVRSLLEQCGWHNQNMNDIDRTVEYNVLQVWVAENLDTLSAAHDLRPGANDVDLGKEELFVEDPRGFNSILNGMTQDLKDWGAKIHLDTSVEKIDYTAHDDDVDANDDAIHGQVTVTARDLKSKVQRHFHADAVVCTVSLGVLQSDAIEFVPAIPKWKHKAWDELGMFVFAKVFVKFDDRLNLSDRDQFVICNSENEPCYPLWMKYKNTDQNIFLCYLGGKEAKRVEALSTEEIKNEIQALFQKVFGKSSYNSTEPTEASIFRPVEAAVTNWSTNPRFCGSYSFYPINAFATVPVEDFTCGLSGQGKDGRQGPTRLCFAGEAFDDMFNGWVQGAYRSGERVAKEIIGIIPNTEM